MDFLNSDTVAHNVFWTRWAATRSSTPQPGHLAQGREAFLQVRQARAPCRCSATFTRRWPATSWSRPTPYFAETDDSRRIQDRKRSRRQLHRDGLARRRQEPVQAGDRGGRHQSGFHPEQVSEYEGAAVTLLLPRSSSLPEQFRSKWRPDSMPHAETIQKQASRRGLAATRTSPA